MKMMTLGKQTQALIHAHPESKYNGEKLSSYLPQANLQRGSQHIEINGNDFMVVLIHIPSENWYVDAIVDENIAYASVTTLRNNAIIYSLIAVFTSIIALTILIRPLLRPLDELNNAQFKPLLLATVI
ncbi:hypothetical protein ACPV5V_11350 [Vibrio campbellii]